MRFVEIARVCHEANRALCLLQGDQSQPPWDMAPAWQKDSAENGVANRVANPEGSPADSHYSWLAQKEDEGWCYGPVKDPEILEHPCMVPYEDLPEDQRIKDDLFIAIVDALWEGS